MANYEGVARSNYFQVLDVDAFRTWAKDLELEVIEDADEPGAVGLISRTDDGAWPACDLETMEDIDFGKLLAQHLAPGQIAILMEIGHEKTCYLGGYAVAINSEGRQVSIGLFDIYKLARKKFKVDNFSYAEF